MIPLVILATAIVLMEPNEAMLRPGQPVAPSGITAAHRTAPLPSPKRENCVVPANLPPDPSVAYVEDRSGVPADLPGPHYEIPSKIDIPLELYLPPPAPFGTEISLGHARIDTKSGAVSLNGQSYSAVPKDCR